jgi:hypothetical protein
MHTVAIVLIILKSKVADLTLSCSSHKYLLRAISPCGKGDVRQIQAREARHVLGASDKITAST